jgi:predicted nucleic acid-binding protein
MAIYYMYFPSLTCEIKCGTVTLDIANRQDAHSMTLAVPGIVELFRAVKSKDEVNRKILAF